MKSLKNNKEEQIKYPRGVPLIILNEFCERFSHYGMTTVLSIYLTTILHYDTDTATILYHSYVFMCYFFPAFGAIIADSFLGKYKTILFLSIIYAIGNIVLSTASATVLHLPQRAFSFLALVLIAIGTGGIKPCVSAFGGDQFILPQQQRHVERFFSIFYFSVNAGSLISTALTPILREDVKCFGENSCFPLAFGVPAILMITAILTFVVGTPLYVRKKPKGNIIVTVTKCIKHALLNKVRIGKMVKKDHWLQYADDKYSNQQISDIHAVLKVLYLFIPLPLFWALFDQQGSRFTFQATNMDGRFFGYIIKPDQINVVNPFLVLTFLPLFEICVYPLLQKIGVKRAVQKMTLGGVLAAAAFVISAILEFKLEKTYPELPKIGEGQIRLYNALDCNVTVQPELNGLNRVSPLSVQEILHIPVNKSQEYYLTMAVDSSCSSQLKPWNGTIKVTECDATSYFISQNSTGDITIWSIIKEKLVKNKNGSPKIRVFYSLANNEIATVKVVNNQNKNEMRVANNELTNFVSIQTGRYDILLNDNVVLKDIDLTPGTISTIILHHNQEHTSGRLFGMVPPNSIHILWQLPQIIVLTVSEILFSTTGLEFSFTQAPESMKSVLSAGWLLTVAFGNLIVVVIAEIKLFESQAYEFLLFASLLLLDMGIFALMSHNYKYMHKDGQANGYSVNDR